MNKIKKVLYLGLIAASSMNFAYSMESNKISECKFCALELPETVSEFYDVKQVGQGGCGAVFKAKFKDKSGKEHIIALKNAHNNEASIAQKLVDNYEKIKDCPFLMHAYKVYDKKKQPEDTLSHRIWNVFGHEHVVAYEYIDGKVIDSPGMNPKRESWCLDFYRTGESVDLDEFVSWCKGDFLALKLFADIFGRLPGEIKDRNVMMQKLPGGKWRPVLIDFGDLCDYKEGVKAAACILSLILRVFNNSNDPRKEIILSILSNIEDGKPGYVKCDDIIDKLNYIGTYQN